MFFLVVGLTITFMLALKSAFDQEAAVEEATLKEVAFLTRVLQSTAHDVGQIWLERDIAGVKVVVTAAEDVALSRAPFSSEAAGIVRHALERAAKAQ